MRAIVFHNPSAGDDCPPVDPVLTALRQHGATVACVSLQEPDFLDALRAPTDLVVIAGGDGSVGTIITHVPDRNVQVAILPLGTANDFARSLKITWKPEDFATCLPTCRRQPLDIGVAAGPWGRQRFLEGVGIGALAHGLTIADAEDPPSQKKIPRGREMARKALQEAEPLRLRITLDGQALPRDLLLVEALNIEHTGPGLRLAPRADPGDGLLDVVCLEAGRRADMIAWLEDPERGDPPVTVRQGRRLTFEWSREALRVDDDFLPAPEQSAQVSVELEQGAVSVVVP